LATVLVIEDDPTILENTLELLELEGFTPISAVDGVEGVARAREHLPDIVVCDVLMPRMDGYGVLRTLRNDPTTRDIPLIFVSATLHEDIVNSSDLLGVSGYLIKPFRFPELVRVIRALLAKQ
jgi:CheY-like chemotaxis protein